MNLLNNSIIIANVYKLDVDSHITYKHYMLTQIITESNLQKYKYTVFDRLNA